MNRFIYSGIGQLRIIAFLEGLSLLLLMFVAMPLKYAFDSPAMVKYVGQIHGILFLFFIVYTLYVSFDKKWKFGKSTIWVLLSSILPFGTFVADHKIMGPKHRAEEAAKG